MTVINQERPLKTPEACPPGLRNVVALGMVSFLTDVASHMVYPLIPGFVRGLGASMTLVGVIEGIAESTASVFRGVFGRWADRTSRRLPFIFSGYAISALSKPILSVVNSWAAVLAIRFADRLGKAIRTPARDAVIAASVTAEQRGLGFGLHRALDQLGAVLGPGLAMALLYMVHSPGSDRAVRWVFLLSAVPGILALCLVPRVRDVTASSVSTTPRRLDSSPLRIPGFLTFLIAMSITALGTPSDAFFLLRARELGIPAAAMPGLWMAYNLSSVIASAVGPWSDRGIRRPFVAAVLAYGALVRAAFGWAAGPLAMWALCVALGIFYGASECLFRAYVADLVPPERRASAYGLYHALTGTLLIPSSVLVGALWDHFGSRTAWLTSAAFSLIGFLVLATVHDRRRLSPTASP